MMRERIDIERIILWMISAAIIYFGSQFLVSQVQGWMVHELCR